MQRLRTIAPRLQLLAPWLVGLVLFAWVFGPALLAPRTTFVGEEFIDYHGTLWFFWWVDHALSEGQPLLQSTWLFHPWGKDLYAHTGGNVLDGLMAMPLRRVLGPVLGMNLWCALVLLSNAGATALLARALGASRPGWWLAAGLGLLHPYALRELALGRPTQALLCFSILFMVSLAGAPSVKAGVWGGVCLGLSGLCYWYYGLIGALVGVLGGTYQLILGSQRRLRLIQLLVSASVAAMLVLPAAWPMLVGLGEGEIPGLFALGESGGVLGRLLLQTVEGDKQGLTVLALDGRSALLLDQGSLTVQPGEHVILLAPLLAALLVLVRPARSEALGIAWVALLVFVAAGPAFVVGESLLPNLAYQALVEHLEVFRRWWWPGRASGALVAVLAVLAALGLQRLPESWRWPAAALVVLGASAQLHSEQGAPLGRWSAEVGPGIACLAEQEGAVIELPWEGGQRPLYHQTVHHRPALNGMLITKEAFVPTPVTELLAHNGLLEHLLALGGRTSMVPLEVVSSGDRQELLDLGYRYVVFRLSAFERASTTARGSRTVSDWTRVRRLLLPGLGEPALQDDYVAIYALDGSALSCP